MVRRVGINQALVGHMRDFRKNRQLMIPMEEILIISSIELSVLIIMMMEIGGIFLIIGIPRIVMVVVPVVCTRRPRQTYLKATPSIGCSG